MNLKEFYWRTYFCVSLFFCVWFFIVHRKMKQEHLISRRIRVSMKLWTQYGSALTGSATGWNATIKTGTGGIFHFHFRFNESNRVFMYADINLETATTAKESSYRLKALQTPALIFDTYSYLHILADPGWQCKWRYKWPGTYF